MTISCLGTNAPLGRLTKNTAGGVEQSYTYDGVNQRISGTTAYAYDGEGRRVKKTVGSTTTVYVYDAQGQLAAEYSTQGPAPVGTQYLTADHLGTTRLVTNATGGVVERRDYLPFGRELTSSNGRSGVTGYASDSGVRQKFTGKERDAETGLDYFLARYYSAVQGRFTSADPLLNSGRPRNPQSWNRYTYALNNPLKFTDPTGLYEWGACSGSDTDCANYEERFRESLSCLKMARDSYDKKSREHKRLNAALAAYGKEGAHNGVTVGFQALDSEGRTDPVGDAHSYSVLFDPAKMGTDAKIFATAVGHEGTHVDDFNQMLGGASMLSLFSLEYRGYETSSMVFQGLYTPRPSASSGFSMGGVASQSLIQRGIEIWNTSWAAADAPKLRDSAITNVVTGLDSKHPETVPHDPWK